MEDVIKFVRESIPPATSKTKYAESSMKLTAILLLEKSESPMEQMYAVDDAIAALEAMKVMVG